MPPATASATPSTLRIGRFELQPLERRLLRDDKPVPLGARAFDLLLVLLERPGALITKHELLERVWGRQVVEENNIAVQVNTLRKLLGGEVIVTIPGRGYRFVAPVGATLSSPSVHDAAAPVLVEPAPRLQTQLPRSMSALLGREDELLALGAMVERHRLVSVIGSGGIGKTLLVQHLLTAQEGGYRHGVCWVELGPISDPAALPGAIAAGLGVQPGGGDPLTRLAAAVGPLQVLLALDNAEHMVADVARLAEQLLEAAPGLRLIVTSQAPLNIQPERVYRLGGLAVPDEHLPAEQALGYGAVALFTDRAQAADARFVLTDAGAPAVIDLCRALDGMALAIELAAARVPVLGVQRLAESMHERLRLLTTNRNRTAPLRQQTLRAALEWSHGFLTSTEQAVFRRMAVLAGSGSLELVQQIAADVDGHGPIDAWMVLDTLGVLVDRSLVSMLHADLEEIPRYKLLDSPRAYALEQLAVSGETDAVRQAHARAMAAHFDAAWEECFSGRVGIEDWRNLLSTDLENARQALAWAVSRGEATLVQMIGPTWSRATPLSMHTERVEIAGMCETLIRPDVPVRLRLRTLTQIAPVWANARRLQQSRASATEAVRLARSIGDEGGGDPCQLYLALAVSASVAASMGDTASANASLAELHALEAPHWPAITLGFGAEAAMFTAYACGDYAEFLRTARRSYDLNRAAGDHNSLPLSNLVLAELAAGNAQVAVAHGTALVAKLTSSRDEFSLNFARMNLMAALLTCDDCPQARSLAEASWPEVERYDFKPEWVDFLTLLTALEGRMPSSAGLFGYSEALHLERERHRGPTGLATVERAGALARAALGDAEFERLRSEGEGWRDGDVQAAAFGVDMRRTPT